MQEIELSMTSSLPILAQADGDALVWLRVVAHILHVLAAVVLAGGVFYQRFVLLPDDEKEPTTEAATERATARRARWSKWIVASALFLLVSGLYSIGMIEMNYRLPGYYRPLFLVKFLLALWIFFISSILAGRTAAAHRFRQKLRKWLTWNVIAAVVVIVIAGVLSRADKAPKLPREAAPEFQAEPALQPEPEAAQ